MQSTRWQFVVSLFGAALITSACGAMVPARLDTASATLDSALDAGFLAVSGDTAQPGSNCDPNAASDPNHAVCHTLWERQKADREAVAQSAEWQALVATPEWATVQADIKKAVDNNCKAHDPTPTAQCETFFAQIKADFAVLRTTKEYATAEATAWWQVLKADYELLKAIGCHHHDHAQHEHP